MSTITITNGVFRNETINGTFVMADKFRQYSKRHLENGSAKDGCEGFVKVFLESSSSVVSRVHVNQHEIQYNSTGEVEITTNAPFVAKSSAVEIQPEVITPEMIQSIGEKIERRFMVMSILSQAVCNGRGRSTIFSGAPGIGKTFTLERDLKKAEEEGTINKLTHVKGKVTPLYLFKLLWDNQSEGDVLLLDDCDSVFDDETALNLLKAAMDTGDERWVSYGSATKWLEEQGIENTFEFRGTILFITNYNFDKMMNSNNKFAPHFEAMMSRTNYCDLAIHDKLSIMIRINQIATKTSVLSSRGISDEMAAEMLAWLWDNYTKTRELSIRTLLKLADYADMSSDWKMLASELLLK